MAHVQLTGLWRNVREAILQESAAFSRNLFLLCLGCCGQWRNGSAGEVISLSVEIDK